MMLASVLEISGVAVSRRSLWQGLRQLRAGNAIAQAGEVERC